MSQVTMCDFCGATTRQAAEVKKVKLPVGIVPEVLTTIGVAGEVRDLDACAGCQEELRLLFESFVSRRLGLTPDITMRCPACGSDQIRIPGAPTAMPGTALDPAAVAAECAACPRTGTLADFTTRIEAERG